MRGRLAWGATYFVTWHALLAQLPLWGSALRALPAGLVLLLVARRLPHGRWWWRSAVLGLLNTSVFFVLVYVASQRLQTSPASTVMATSPFVLMLVARPLLGQHPTRSALVGAALGVLGVVAMRAPAALLVEGPPLRLGPDPPRRRTRDAGRHGTGLPGPGSRACAAFPPQPSACSAS